LFTFIVLAFVIISECHKWSVALIFVCWC